MRAVVVDDSVVFRRVVSEALERIPGVQVVATASNGRQAVQRVLELKPDLVSLDIEMPELDGLQVLEALRDARCDAGVIVLSGLTARASSLTVKALERGAFDFITKPAADSIEQSKDMVFEALRPRVNALARRREIQALLRRPGGAPTPAPRPPVAELAPKPPRRPRVPRPGRHRAASRSWCWWASRPAGRTRWPAAAGHPQGHRRAHPDRAAHAAHVHGLPGGKPGTPSARSRVREARRRRGAGGEHGLHRTRRAADAGRHRGGNGVIQVTDDPPENNCRPAVDYLFRSAAGQFPGRAMAVILTGMGSDGILGLRLLKRHGCHVVAQDEASCVVYGMPRAAVEAGVVDAVLPLDQIAARIATQVRGGLF